MRVGASLTQLMIDALKLSDYLLLSVSLSIPPLLFTLVIATLFHYGIKSIYKSKVAVFSPAGAGFLSSYFSLIGGSFSVFPIIAIVLISGFLANGYKFDEKRVRASLLEYKIFGAVFSLVFVVCSNYYDRAYTQNGSVKSEQAQQP
jgi:hypothetical protein